MHFFSLKRDLANLDSSLERGNSSLARKFPCNARPMPFQLATIRVGGSLLWDNLLLCYIVQGTGITSALVYGTYICPQKLDFYPVLL